MKYFKLSIYSIIITLVLIAFFSLDASAQCAMCKAVPTSNQAGGGKIGVGLNSGIMYLLVIPYILLTVGAYMFFKKPIDEKIKKLLKRNT